MKKEEICVLIDSEEKRLRALAILKMAGVKCYKNSHLLRKFEGSSYFIGTDIPGIWGLIHERQEIITINQLEELLSHNYVVKDIHLTIDELKQQAENLGFELVEKKRVPKDGDFGVFWDDEESNKVLGFISELKHSGYITNSNGGNWKNFRHLTDGEKEKIQNNW